MSWEFNQEEYNDYLDELQERLILNADIDVEYANLGNYIEEIISAATRLNGLIIRVMSDYEGQPSFHVTYDYIDGSHIEEAKEENEQQTMYLHQMVAAINILLPKKASLQGKGFLINVLLDESQRGNTPDCFFDENAPATDDLWVPVYIVRIIPEFKYVSDGYIDLYS